MAGKRYGTIKNPRKRTVILSGAVHDRLEALAEKKGDSFSFLLEKILRQVLKMMEEE